MEVRRQDLEAVAVRVDGVRYVNDIRFGVEDAAGNLQDKPSLKITGLKLPWLSGIEVGSSAAPLDVFTGVAPEADDVVPVPVIPKKC
jgi:hypothetical protein